MPSIISVVDAADVVKHVPDGDRPVSCPAGPGVTVMVRRAAKCNRSTDWQPVLTGGVYASVALEPPPYSKHEHWIRRARLGPGWSVDALRRAVIRLLDQAHAEKRRRVHVAPVADLAERLLGAARANRCLEQWRATVHREEQVSGHSAVYDAMTIEGAEHWRQWLTRQLERGK